MRVIHIYVCPYIHSYLRTQMQYTNNIDSTSMGVCVRMYIFKHVCTFKTAYIYSYARYYACGCIQHAYTRVYMCTCTHVCPRHMYMNMYVCLDFISLYLYPLENTQKHLVNLIKISEIEKK